MQTSPVSSNVANLRNKFESIFAKCEKTLPFPSIDLTHSKKIPNAVNLRKNLLPFPKPSETPFPPKKPVPPLGQDSKYQDVRILEKILGLKPIPALKLTDEEIGPFLINNIPNLHSIWNTLRTSFEKNGPSFLDDGNQELQAIHNQIIALFEKDMPIHLFSDETKQQLKSLELEGKTLIARSSSEEDHPTEGMNAGGNDSIPGIQTTPAAIWQAVGKVIVSYFSVKSLKNRSYIGNPFNKLPSLSVVLMQQVIEVKGDPSSIPVSGVLVTSKPAYVDGGRLRVTTLNAAYGYGKGVVENQVTTDSCVMLRSASNPSEVTIYYENRIKEERLICSSENPGELLRAANSEEAQKQPAIKPEHLRQLFEYAEKVEKHYRSPRNLEFVIQNGALTFVQNRPVVLEAAPLPRFFHTDKKTVSFSCQALVPAHSSIVILNNPQELLLTKNLDEAERSSFKKGQHRVILTPCKEAEDSHPAVNFSSMRPPIPCLYMNKQDFDELQKRLKTLAPYEQVLVCIQTGQVVIWNTKLGEIQECIQEGWHSHPCGIKLSLPIPTEPSTLTETLNLTPQWKKILEQLKSPSFQKVNEGLKEAFNAFRTTLNRIRAQANFKKKHFEIVADAIETKAKEIFKEIQACGQSQKATRLETLLHVKMLENLVRQNNSPLDNTHSLLGLEKELEKYHHSNVYLSKNPNGTWVEEASYADKAFSKDTSERWLTFLEMLETPSIPSEVKQELKTLLHSINELNLLPSWLFLCFGPLSKKFEGLDLAQQLIKEFTAQDKSFVELVKKERKVIQDFTQRLEAASSQQQMQTSWSDLNKYLSNWTKNDELSFSEKMSKTSLIGQLAGLQAYLEVINCLDAHIKKVKTCGFYSEALMEHEFDQRVRLFLLNYLLSFAQIYPGRNYQNKLYKLFNDLKNAPLNSERDFNLHAWLISTTFAVRPVITSTDDMFTVIHQNMLTILSLHFSDLMKDQLNKGTLDLPKPLEKFVENLKKNNDFAFAKPVGLIINQKQIILQWFIPMQGHGFQLEIIYDKETDTILLPTTFVGWTTERGKGMRDCAFLIGELGGIQEGEKPDLNRAAQKLTFTWKIKDWDQIPRFLTHLATVFNLSFAKSFDERTQAYIFKYILEHFSVTKFDLYRILLNDLEDDFKNGLPYLIAGDNGSKEFISFLLSLPEEERKSLYVKFIKFLPKIAESTQNENEHTQIKKMVQNVSFFENFTIQEILQILQDMAEQNKNGTFKFIEALPFSEKERGKYLVIGQWLFEELKQLCTKNYNFQDVSQYCKLLSKFAVHEPLKGDVKKWYDANRNNNSIFLFMEDWLFPDKT